ncbi:MAG: hypothetical protein KGJ55_05535 [Gammaproteobacteria bacterium]|nr:hypothetical protein [Gammaproteobacteria bacterium]
MVDQFQFSAKARKRIVEAFPRRVQQQAMDQYIPKVEPLVNYYFWSEKGFERNKRLIPKIRKHLDRIKKERCAIANLLEHEGILPPLKSPLGEIDKAIEGFDRYFPETPPRGRGRPRSVLKSPKGMLLTNLHAAFLEAAGKNARGFERVLRKTLETCPGAPLLGEKIKYVRLAEIARAAKRANSRK